jgi:hypothetical protein
MRKKGQRSGAHDRNEESSGSSELAPCPRCGKRKGEFKDVGSGRFRYLVICGAYAWSAGPARIKDVAVKPVERGEAGA